MVVRIFARTNIMLTAVQNAVLAALAKTFMAIRTTDTVFAFRTCVMSAV